MIRANARRIFGLAPAVVLLGAMVACGGTAGTPRSTGLGSPSPNATPTTPAPAPTPPATPTPPAPPTPSPMPTPTPTSSPAQFQVTLFSGFSGSDAHGQVSVDGAGNVTVQLTAATANTAFTAQFCPFPSTRYSCLAVGSLSTDATGAGTTTFHFPKPGPWAGDFQVTANGTGFSTHVGSNTGQLFFATLEPANVTNGQGTGHAASSSATPQEAGGGNVTVSGGTVHVVLTGATPNTQYVVVQCFLSDASGCFQLGPFNGNTFTTDAAGNATFDVATAGIPGDFFAVSQAIMSIATPTPAGFAAGFKAQ